MYCDCCVCCLLFGERNGWLLVFACCVCGCFVCWLVVIRNMVCLVILWLLLAVGCVCCLFCCYVLLVFFVFSHVECAVLLLLLLLLLMGDPL